MRLNYYCQNVLQLDSLKARRCIFDMTEVYRILHNSSDTCNSKFFELSSTLSTPGHNFKLARSQEFAMGGGLFRRCETKPKQFTFGIGTILCPKLGEDQKKVFALVGIEFCDRILFKSKVK